MDSLTDRRTEWFVPRFGPLKFRVFVGLLFLPYTGMVLSYTLIGAMLAETIYWDRVFAIVLIYFLGLGVAAHALDAIGGKGTVKPWGNHFSKRSLWLLAIFSLIPAYTLGFYYIIFHSPLLLLIAILEGFFLFAYNLEWFEGRFHTDGCFTFSWGALPVLGGYIIQTNGLSLTAIAFAAAMGLLSFVEINASRPYKEMKRSGKDKDRPFQKRYEHILVGISLGVILLAVAMVCWRLGL
ncbi:hypothetical protein JYT92_00480 [bacterium AH-315-L15]|nr:hypothetical protein [bacterium AH-315-L15]